MTLTMREGRAGILARLRGYLRPACDLLAVMAIGAILWAGWRSIPVAAVVVPYPHELAQVSFAVAGDVIPHEPVRAAADCGRRRRQRAGARSSAM